MTLPRFNFVGVTSDEYPDSSTQVKFGRGYSFATRPRGPDQILTKVAFPSGLYWMEDQVTRNIDFTSNPTLNVGALIRFYEDVRMYGVFEFDHPIRGVTNYRFLKPLAVPAIVNDPGAIGGLNGLRTHQTASFDVQLILLP